MAKIVQLDAMPTRKVGWGLVGGTVVTFLTWLIGVIWDTEIPPEIYTAITTIVTFILSYFTHDSADRETKIVAS